MGISCRQRVFDQSACSDEATNHHLFVCVCVCGRPPGRDCMFFSSNAMYMFLQHYIWTRARPASDDQ